MVWGRSNIYRRVIHSLTERMDHPPDIIKRNRSFESDDSVRENGSYCTTDPRRLRILGPMIIAMTILQRSAGINGITQTARAADAVYPDWKQNQTVPSM